MQINMRTYAAIFCALISLSSLTFSACKDDDVVEDIDEGVNPGDANALSDILALPTGSTPVSGNLPSPSGAATAPRLKADVSQVTSSNGSTALLRFSYTPTDANLVGAYLQVVGAGEHFALPEGDLFDDEGTLLLPVGIPGSINQGRFCVSVSIYDTRSHVSNAETVCIDVLRLGTGVLQVSLTWNNASDQDIYVTDPLGETITVGEETSSSGGMLDKDDTDGFGPENVFWLETAPDGEYVVQVEDFNRLAVLTKVFVTITSPSIRRTFTGTTTQGNTVEVVRFRKSGNAITF